MRKKGFAALIVLVLIISTLIGCSGAGTSTTSTDTEAGSETKQDAVNTSKSSTDSAKSNYSSESKNTTTTNFTNAYGTPTTKCAHPGCNNYIASSGDTNCCPTHSNKCLDCGKYIDEDAMYCISCLSEAAESTKKDDFSYSYDDNDSYDEYGYDTSDPYYSANDHDGDGKINDQEFQDAMNDAIDDLLKELGE